MGRKFSLWHGFTKKQQPWSSRRLSQELAVYGYCQKKKKKKRLLNIKKIQIGKYPSSVTVGAAVTSTARLFPHSGVRIQHRTKHEFVQSFSLCTVVWLNT